MTSKAVKKLADCFLGEMVVFYLIDMNVAAFTENGESMKISGMTEGYVVDIDVDFFYLGQEDGSVDKIIKHEVIGMVEVAELDEEAVFKFPVPSDEDEIH